MPIIRYIPALVFACFSGQLWAEEPLSAIDWLSESIDVPPEYSLTESPVSNAILVEPITVLPLDAPSPDAVGLFSPSVAGLPRDLWGPSDSLQIASAIREMEVNHLPALMQLLKIILLAEADAPDDSDGSVLLARIDALLEIGALDEARALMELTEVYTPELFRRWFDVALLTGNETEACNALRERGDIAPSYQARIFCLARNGDWDAAVLTLNSAALLGQVSDDDYYLMARFLDPDIFDGEEVDPAPDTPSPLEFRMYEAIGEPIPTRHLPRAFAHADLRNVTGWKLRVEAAERLARVSVISDNQLLGIYTEREPAASGGVWERVDAVQRFDAALLSGDTDAINDTLPRVWLEMQHAGLERPFANIYSLALIDYSLSTGASSIVQRVLLLSDDYEQLAQHATGVQTAELRFLRALATGQMHAAPSIDDSPFHAVRTGFDPVPPHSEDKHLLDQRRLGEAVLQAIRLFSLGVEGDHEQITRALRLLRSVGLEDTARQAALQFLIMQRRGA